MQNNPLVAKSQYTALNQVNFLHGFFSPVFFLQMSIFAGRTSAREVPCAWIWKMDIHASVPIPMLVNSVNLVRKKIKTVPFKERFTQKV